MKGGDGQAATEVRLFLREARPTWRLSQVIMAESKLTKVGISSVSQLLEVLSRVGRGSLNEMLIASGETTFTEDTLAALHSHATSSPPKPSVPRRASKDAEDGKPKVSATRTHPATSSSSAEYQPREQRQQATVTTTAEQEQKQEQDLRQRFERSRKQNTKAITKKEAMEARAEAEEQLEDAMADLQSCKENGWQDAVAEKEMEVERLKGVLFELAVADNPALKEQVEKEKKLAEERQENNKQLAAWAQAGSNMESGSASSSAAPAVARREHGRDSKDIQSDVQWFNVVFRRVFVKKEPHEDAKSWGFVHEGQTIQVLPKRAKDLRGREWVELTFFELFRSCLKIRKDRTPKKICNGDEQRGFCLIDASDMNLGALLAGPLPRSDWPEIDHGEAEDFCQWAGQDIESVIPALKVPTVESKDTQQFKAVQELRIHEKPDLKSAVFGKKTPGTLVYAEKGIFNGWVKLAGEPGWVLFDIKMDMNAEARETAVKAAEDKMVRDSLHFQKGLSPEFVQAMSKDEELRLRDALDKWDEVPLETLQLAVTRVKAFARNTPLLRLGLQKLQERESLGESGCKARQMRRALDQAQTEQDVREIIQQCQDAGLSEVAMEARNALSKYLDYQANARIEHGQALEDLIAAIKAGSPTAITAARDAARAAGVPKKELARAFALAQADQ